jgi:hypothetical protein
MPNKRTLVVKGQNSPKEYSSHNQVRPVKFHKFESFVKNIMPSEEDRERIVP